MRTHVRGIGTLSEALDFHSLQWRAVVGKAGRVSRLVTDSDTAVGAIVVASAGVGMICTAA